MGKGFHELWAQASTKHGHGLIAEWTQKEVTKFAIPLVESAKSLDVLAKCIEKSFSSWEDYRKFVKKELGWDNQIAKTPTLAFVSASKQAWLNFPSKHKPVESMFVNKMVLTKKT